MKQHDKADDVSIRPEKGVLEVSLLLKIECVSKKFVVIVKKSKLVYVNGSDLAMPVKIVPFCWKFTAQMLRLLFKEGDCLAKLRTLPERYRDLKTAYNAILRISDVVEDGLFLDMATSLIVAGEHGVTVKNKA
ncbi:hypothetical protein L2E82_15382 [Cichorium intybus]|uniref:Uncharacterized protein n=1 Tax=Cichorium intybus TaxID=13427 RepID=A0ACB9F366_CICIN|nr:hypothetical protein L2E82_15382 [Cichorium intybus]